MSAADTYVQDLARLREIETILRNELNRHHADEARALEDALRQTLLANRAESPSLRESHGSAAHQARQKALEAGSRAREVAQRISRNEKLQENTLSRLRSAERAGQLAVHLEAERARRESPVYQLERILRREALHSPTSDKLRVLYLTTSPYLDLSTELELRQVQQALRGSRYRERVDVQMRSATTLRDLIAGLNSVRPHIVHFSAPAGEAFRLDDGDDLSGGDDVDFSALAQALYAADQPPQLLMLDACGPLKHAVELLPAVPVVVGLPDSMLDTAGIVFSQHFFAAVASGQSVGAAFRLGKAKIEAVLLDDDASGSPECVVRDDVDLEALVLVQV